MLKQLDRTTAQDWLARWDTQQERYVADREDRFLVIGDVIEHICAEQISPEIVDLGCGPGSLTARLATRFPAAHITGLDTDPFLLALAEATRPSATASPRYLDLDLATPGWAQAVTDGHLLSAVTTTTALHWLRPPRLAALYREVADNLRPGGVFVNADNLYDQQPALEELTSVIRRRRAERNRVERNEAWQTWWNSLRQDSRVTSVFSPAQLAGCSTGYANRCSPQWHLEALSAAGFSETGTVWQHGNDYILVGIR